VRPQAGDAGRARWPIKLFRLLLRVIFHMFFRVKVLGLENVPNTPVIVCANHLGWADPFLILLFLPIEPRIYVLGEQQVAHISAFRRFMITKLQVMVALDRSKPREAIRVMEDVLKRGGSLLIFPEGRLGFDEGELSPLQNGAAHISLVSGAPLLPVGLTGTSQLWLRRHLTVRVGGPIEPTQVTGDLRTRVTTLTEQLAADMRRLLPGDRDHTKVRLLRRWLTNLL
jgi:1-acyl-sn-glycerol-3-phosphate acyltransferase